MRRTLMGSVAVAMVCSGCALDFDGEDRGRDRAPPIGGGGSGGSFGGSGSGSSGFGGSFGGSTSCGGPSAPRPSCNLDSGEESAASTIYSQTEGSIHELVTCGQMQVSVAQSMMAIVLSSNRELFAAGVFEELEQWATLVGLTLEVPFEADALGGWTMPIDTAGPGSTFTVRFYEPGKKSPVLHDPFDIETYLRGVEVDTEYSLAEMTADWDLRNTFTFRYVEEGPLAHLLNDGEPIPNPFEVRVSIADLAALAGFSLASSAGAEFGPLESLVDSEMTSRVTFSDRRGGVEIDYAVNGQRDTVGEVASSGSVGMDVDEIVARTADYELVGNASDLRYVRQGALAGTIRYELFRAGRPVVDVESDFGDGCPYPVTRWECID